jgi:hypothetical protein
MSFIAGIGGWGTKEEVTARGPEAKRLAMKGRTGRSSGKPDFEGRSAPDCSSPEALWRRPPVGGRRDPRSLSFLAGARCAATPSHQRLATRRTGTNPHALTTLPVSHPTQPSSRNAALRGEPTHRILLNRHRRRPRSFGVAVVLAPPSRRSTPATPGSRRRHRRTPCCPGTIVCGTRSRVVREASVSGTLGVTRLV